MRQHEREKSLLRIFPGPPMRVPLQGVYLGEPFGPPLDAGKRFVYASFIASLDGRISLPAPSSDRFTVPAAIANPRDFRLFQELLASADVLVTSGRYVRRLRRGVSSRSFPISAKPEYAHLHRWRRAQGLPPQPAVAIVTASLELPSIGALATSGRRVYIATGDAAHRERAATLESEGARVLRVGEGGRAQGERLVEALSREGLRNIALIGGGEILSTLLVDGALDRLYLTVACRILGGSLFDTLCTGARLDPPARFELRALHYDAEDAGGVEQLFAILDAKR